MSGSIWNQVPVWVRNWEVVVDFKVAGKGKDLFGDGFAIWVDFTIFCQFESY
jgi:lectin, mannose-binding 2